jgi:hypothetical protein
VTIQRSAAKQNGEVNRLTILNQTKQSGDEADYSHAKPIKVEMRITTPNQPKTK